MENKKNVISKSSFSLLFNNKIRLLSVSHAINAIALFIYNGTLVYILKDIFLSKDYEVSIYYVCTMIASTLGSIFIVKVTSKYTLPHSIAPYLRFGYFVLFAFISMSDNYFGYMFFTSLLCLLHAFCIPMWQDMFQSNSFDSEWKLIGTSRKALVSICGVFGSLIGGYLIELHGISITFLVASVLSFISFSTIFVFTNRKNVVRVN